LALWKSQNCRLSFADKILTISPGPRLLLAATFAPSAYQESFTLEFGPLFDSKALGRQHKTFFFFIKVYFHFNVNSLFGANLLFLVLF
jgi:hypothetical protein